MCLVSLRRRRFRSSLPSLLHCQSTIWMGLAIILRSDLLQPNSFIQWLKQWLQDIENCRVLRHLFEINMLNIFHVPTKHQLADIFTKLIGHVQFFKLLSKMGILNIYAPSWEGVLKSMELEGIKVGAADIWSQFYKEMKTA